MKRTPFTIALTLAAGAAWLAAATVADADALSTVQMLRQGGCGGVVPIARPLKHNPLLDRVAGQWAAGVVRSGRSGDWSDPATWDNRRVPGAAARVQVRAGHTVRFDVQTPEPIRSVLVAGTLTFARDRDTRR